MSFLIQAPSTSIDKGPCLGPSVYASCPIKYVCGLSNLLEFEKYLLVYIMNFSNVVLSNKYRIHIITYSISIFL